MRISLGAVSTKEYHRLLLIAFKEAVLYAVVNQEPFVSDEPSERMAFATHTHLLEVNPKYRSKIAAVVNLSEEFQKTELIRRLEKLSEGDMSLLGHVKASIMIIPHVPMLLKGHLLSFQLTSIISPYLKRTLV